jgi:DNA-binding MarR family transcriptional regulator
MRKPIDNVNRQSRVHADQVMELVHTVMHQLRLRQLELRRGELSRGQARGDGAQDITHMDTKVLGYFGHHPGATQSDLAEHSGRDKAQLARLIKGLRDRGLLSAEADAADRRHQRLTLTAEGLALQRTLQQQARRLSARAVAGFSAIEIEQLLGLLQRVRGNLDNEAA